MSFRRFLGLAFDEAVPDGTTPCRFRARLAQGGLGTCLLEAVNAQLAARGPVPRRGTLIDATLIEADAAVRKRTAGEPAIVEREASSARRRGKAFFGYKGHIGVGRGSGLVRRVLVTPVDVHDSVVPERLISGDEAAVIAKRGYDPFARRADLEARGVRDLVMREGRRGHPLEAAAIAPNRSIQP